MKGKERAVNTVIFDLDGTLVDAYTPVAESLNFVRESFGLDPVDHQSIRREVGWGQRYLIEQFVPEEKVDEGVKLYRDHHQKALLDGVQLFPGVRKLLTYLKEEGYNAAIATNRPEKYTLIILDELEISGFFREVLCADKIPNAKPEPDILNILIEKFKCGKENVLYVGDMIVDVQTGRNAGVKTVVVPTGSSTEEELLAEKPLRILRRIDGAIGVLEELNG